MGLLDELMITPEDKTRAQYEGLLSMGLGILANNTSKNPFPAFAKGGMMGMDQYKSSLGELRQQKMQDFMLKQKAEEIARQQKQEAAFTQIREQLPEQVRPMFDADRTGFLSQMNKQQEEYTLTPGARRFRGQQEIAAAPMEPKVPEGMRIGPNGDLEAIPGYIDMKSRIAAAGRAVTNTNVFNNTKDDFKNERDLRNDFAGLPTTKAFNEVQSAYDQINVALQKESPAGDLAAATKIMKILDPGSVVRESELGMAMAATGALDRVSNYAQMLVSGHKLTPSQRKDFGELSSQLYKAASDRYNTSASEFQGIAKDYGLNADRVAKPAQQSGRPPLKGQVMDGYRFKGGNPADPQSWEKVNG